MRLAFINAIRWRAVAGKYAARLGPQMRRDYGASATYTVAQIEASAHRAGLPKARVALGYAAFLTETEFQATALPPATPDYAALRSLLGRTKVANPSAGGIQPVRENTAAFAGAPTWPGGSA